MEDNGATFTHRHVRWKKNNFFLLQVFGSVKDHLLIQDIHTLEMFQLRINFDSTWQFFGQFYSIASIC